MKGNKPFSSDAVRNLRTQMNTSTHTYEHTKMDICLISRNKRPYISCNPEVQLSVVTSPRLQFSEAIKEIFLLLNLSEEIQCKLNFPTRT